MYTIDDPMFALILRFVGYHQAISFYNHEFIQKQLETIQKYIKKYPAEEKRLRITEWIEKYAQEYRKRWEQEVIFNEVSRQRCPDCPLAGVNINEHCRIHEEWTALIQQYTADEIDSREYIESALKLFKQHKEELKIKLSTLQKQGVIKKEPEWW